MVRVFAVAAAQVGDARDEWPLIFPTRSFLTLPAADFLEDIGLHGTCSFRDADARSEKISL